MRHLFFDTPEYKREQADIVHQNWQKGLYKSLVKKEKRSCLNIHCSNYFVVSPSDKQNYCSQNCWYLVRRNYQPKTILLCFACGKVVTHRNAFKFCSLTCQATNNYNQYIKRWKQNLEDGNIGITTRFVSHHIKRYLKAKYKNQCNLCGWNQKNPITDVVPLEVNHIDGNAENNKEENLELICPNCHALTPNFRNLNKGKGREWRINYLKIHKTQNPSP